MKLQLGIVCITALALFSSNTRAAEWHKTWTVGPSPELRVSAGDASVLIEGSDAKQIEASLTTHGWTIGRSGVQVIDHQTGNRVEIEVKVPPSHFSFGDHSIRLEIRVPRQLSGDIHTGDGSIALRDVHGSLRVDTGDGSIHGDNLDGMLNAHSGDGSVHISGRFDNLQVRTADGSVQLEARSGSKVQSDWRVETGDGSVQISLPRDLSANLELSTGDGNIHTGLPLTVNGIKSEHEIRGKLNGGGPAFVVRTGDGSISVNSL